MMEGVQLMFVTSHKSGAGLRVDVHQGIRYMAKESQGYEISFTTRISRLCVCSWILVFGWYLSQYLGPAFTFQAFWSALPRSMPHICHWSTVRSLRLLKVETKIDMYHEGESGSHIPECSRDLLSWVYMYFWMIITRFEPFCVIHGFRKVFPQGIYFATWTRVWIESNFFF